MRLPTWAAVCGVLTGLAVLVLAATANPVPLLRPPSGRATGRLPGSLVTPSATLPTPSSSPTPEAIEPYDLPWLRPVVLGVLVVLGAFVLVGTVVAVVVVARRLWQDRWQAPWVPQAVGGEPVDVDLPASGRAVVEAADELALALRAGSPRNGVVQCWLVLLRSLEEHGVSPHPSQSPTELTRAALSRLPTDARAADELCALFLEARFSEHVIGEDERRRALSALHRVVAGLEHRGSAGAPSVPTGGAS